MMARIDHDELFKRLISTFFLDFIALFLPEVSAYMEPEPPQFLDKEVFADRAKGRRRIADLVAKVRFRGQDACFLIHQESQAKRQTGFNRRMFHYSARLDEQFGLPVYPVALLTYDTPTSPEPDGYRVAFPDFTPLDFRFRVIQLNKLNWRDFVRHQNPVACALMAKMRIAPEERPKVKLECLRLLATLQLDQDKMRLIGEFVDTYLQLTAAEMKVYEQEFAEIESEEQEKVMAIVTSWERKGRQEGLLEGKLDIVLRQLRRRLGKVSPELEAQVQKLSAKRLDALAEALLDFTVVSDLETWLANHTSPTSQ